MLFNIIFQPYGTKIQIQAGHSILHAAQEAGIHIEAYCGGEKSCGKCRIKVIEGKFDNYQIYSSKCHLSPLTEEEKKLFTQTELKSGYRLACTTQVNGDIVVEIPSESQLINHKILAEGEARELRINPAVKIYNLKLEKATLKDNRDDFTRLKDALQMYEELDENLRIDFEALKELSESIQIGKWEVTVYVLYGRKIIRVIPGKIENIYGVAIDIGTTTVVAYLCDLKTGKTLQTGTFVNPQVRYGDDIISRISFCMTNQEGIQILQNILIQEINKTLQEMASAQGILVKEISEVVLVFNTVMEFISLGIKPESLGVSPFVSPISNALDISAKELGIQIMTAGNIHCLPSIAGFVGADHVAVLIAEEPYKQDKMKLIIDIGTNSEICLGNKERLYTTSCATGPALEGAQIKCGMRAAKGAIESVIIDPITLNPQIKIIGEEKENITPIGICGSGILDVVAQMALTGIIEPDGRFSSRIDSNRVRVGDNGKKEYVIYFKENPEERDIVVTMADIRAVQLAKAALYAGAKTLMKKCDISSIDEIVLAGAFGSYINKENALRLGLIPDCSIKNIRVSGNAAGIGAQIALLNIDKRVEAQTVSKAVKFVETATEADFSKCFTQAMVIPHKNDTFTINKPIAFPCSSIHMAGEKTILSEYPYKNIEDLLEKEKDFISKELLQTIVLQNSRKNLPDGMIDMQGAFSILANLVSPVSLYSYGHKYSELLTKVLELIIERMVIYAKEELNNGIEIISFSDPCGVIELVGIKFYEQFSGYANWIFMKEMEPYLDKSLIHLCGKTSYSMEKTGFMLARPYRMDNKKSYIDILSEEAKNKNVKFIGHACINTKRQYAPIYYRMQLNK